MGFQENTWIKTIDLTTRFLHLGTFYILPKQKTTVQMDGGFLLAGAEGAKCPLAVPESRCSRSRSATFDRCANPCSLHPPPAAVASVARHAVLEAQYMVVIVCYNHNR